MDYDPATNDLVALVVSKTETFVRVNQYQYVSDIVHEQRALVAQVAETLEKPDGNRYLAWNQLQQSSQELR